MIERKFIHPHDNRYLVIDTLDENGKMIRTRNELRVTTYCACGRRIWMK